MTKGTLQPSAQLAEALDQVLDRLKSQLLTTLQELVRTPSENLPPVGNERDCQMLLAGRLRELGLVPDLYDIGGVPGLASHPAHRTGRHYAGRPNLDAVLPGAGGGRSLVLSGHIDTVPAETPTDWHHSPFGAQTHDGRMFGRGTWDMKAGVAMNLTVLSAIVELGWKLKGDLIFETVVDEEFGGGAGTLAARLRGYNADAAVIGEPTCLRICPAQRGGQTLHILFTGAGGILGPETSSARAVDQLTYVLGRIGEFAARRGRRVAVDPYFENSPEPFAVWVTNLATGRWGWTQPIAIPQRCRMELYWQAMPSESGEEVQAEFFEWWNEILDCRPDLFPVKPVVEAPSHWLPGCSIPPDSPLVSEFAGTITSLGGRAPVEGLDAPTDMYIFQSCFHTPALLWGPAGGNAHQADEYVDLDSLFEATRVLLQFVPRWCGLDIGIPA